MVAALTVDVLTVDALIEIQFRHRCVVKLPIGEQPVQVSPLHFEQERGHPLARAGHPFDVEHVNKVGILRILVSRAANQFNHTVDRQVVDQCVDQLDQSHLESKPCTRGNVDLTGRCDTVLNHVKGIQTKGHGITAERAAPGIVGTGHIHERLGALNLPREPIALGGLIK